MPDVVFDYFFRFGGVTRATKGREGGCLTSLGVVEALYVFVVKHAQKMLKNDVRSNLSRQRTPSFDVGLIVSSLNLRMG
jgi:hypothetical protein